MVGLCAGSYCKHALIKARSSGEILVVRSQRQRQMQTMVLLALTASVHSQWEAYTQCLQEARSDLFDLPYYERISVIS